MQGFAHGLEQLSRSQKDRRMRVVTAGMHHTRCLRAIWRVRMIFLYRKRIHVRPQRNYWAGESSFNQPYDATFCHIPLVWNARRI